MAPKQKGVICMKWSVPRQLMFGRQPTFVGHKRSERNQSFLPMIEKKFGTRKAYSARAAAAYIALGLLCGATAIQAATSKLDQALGAYDAAITAASTQPLTTLKTPVTLNGTAGSP